MIRIVLADDNPVVRHGLVAILETAEDIEVVAQGSDGAEAIEMVRTHKPDAALLDVRMPRMDGVAAAGVISMTTPVMMLTYTDDEPVVTDALRAGASGYLVHGQFTPDELLRAARALVGGQGSLSPLVAQLLVRQLREAPAAVEGRRADERARFGLSDREVEVMEQVARGRRNGEIAEVLFLSEKTVKNHINRLYGKLGVTSRGEAIATWLGSDSGLTT